jgi:hypothetical protein
VRAQYRHHLIIENIELPLVWRFCDAIDRDEQARVYFSHVNAPYAYGTPFLFLNVRSHGQRVPVI